MSIRIVRTLLPSVLAWTIAIGACGCIAYYVFCVIAGYRDDAMAGRVGHRAGYVANDFTSPPPVVLPYGNFIVTTNDVQRLP